MNRFFLLGCLFLACALTHMKAADANATVNQADGLFKQQRYTESLELYNALFAEGKYSEAMLYRMAYMHEQLKSYAMSIYYLKKAAKEFGNPSVDAKVKQLMQLQGSERFFPSSSWNTYLKLFRQWGWLAWGLFALSIAAIIAHMFVSYRRDAVWRKGLASGAWTLAILLGVVLGHRSFFVPELGVLTEPTAFYDYPGYAGQVTPKAFSQGETVSILDEEDIWLFVQAGDKEYWVPKRVVKAL